MENFTIKNLTADTISLYKKCFDDNGSSKKVENINLQFFSSPNIKGYVDLAYDEEKQKTAAIYAVFSVKFKIGNQIYDATQSLDTITDIDYRGKGLFITLAQDVYKKAQENGAALVYGFPNGDSIHGFKKKLQWEVLDPVPFLIKPLKSKYFTNKIKALSFFPNINLSFTGFSKNKDYKLITKREFPEEVDQIWNQFSKDIKIAVHRDKKYLEWRYLQKPNQDYQIVHCYDLTNKYLGFVIYAIKEKHNGRIGYIMEMLYDINDKKAGNQLLTFAINEIKKSKADCILNWCFDHSPNYSLFKKNFFINMPEKFRPIELHFGARSFIKEKNDLVYNNKNWYLSYSDSDTV
jgi:Acetyltransferase (GNAT) domain